MRLYLLCSMLLLSGCMGRDHLTITAAPIRVPVDLLQTCPGYTGPTPNTEGLISDVLVAEMRGRYCANSRSEAIAEILKPSGP